MVRVLVSFSCIMTRGLAWKLLHGEEERMWGRGDGKWSSGGTERKED